jgi:LysM repeat protein
MQRLLVCLFLSLALAACGSGPAVPGADPGTAAPFQTAMASPTSAPLSPLEVVVLPTPTTFVYTVVAGDTLGAIAKRYGVTLDALTAANPGVQATALSVGTSLVIPTGSAVPGQPTPTPAVLPVRQARCWPEAGGGLWCFALVQNEYAETLENLSVQFTLLDGSGQELASQVAFPLLNILPGGAAMPIAAHFPPPAPVDAAVRVQVLTAIRLLPGDTRYLPASAANTLVGVDGSGRTAQVSGRVVLAETGTANILWVLASAYDADGNVVGVRRWESSSPLTAETPVDFVLQVSSMGPAIDRVELLVEARP